MQSPTEIIITPSAGLRFARRRGRAAPPDEGQLSAAERALLTSHALGPEQHARWVRTRITLRWLMPELGSVLEDDDGAPCPLDRHWMVAAAHAGSHVAVAAAPRHGERCALALELAPHSDTERAPWLLARLAVDPRALGSPLHAWAALRCALELRRQPLYAPRPIPLAVTEASDGGAIVTGLGAPVRIRFLDRAGHLIALGREG